MKGKPFDPRRCTGTLPHSSFLQTRRFIDEYRPIRPERLPRCAETGNFRLVGERLGVSRPAVRQALRRLADGLGIALVQRTTRSVRLTEAGQALHDTTLSALADIDAAFAAARDREAGR